MFNKDNRYFYRDINKTIEYNIAYKLERFFFLDAGATFLKRSYGKPEALSFLTFVLKLTAGSLAHHAELDRGSSFGADSDGFSAWSTCG